MDTTTDPSPATEAPAAAATAAPASPAGTTPATAARAALASRRARARGDLHRRRAVLAALALFYAACVMVWVSAVPLGWSEPEAGRDVYLLILILYALLSLSAVHHKADDARVRVFVVALALAALTIVWPPLDLARTPAGALWFSLIVGSFVYALPFALYVHLASLIPRRHPFTRRFPRFIGLNYALAVAVGAFTALMYADQALRLQRGAGLPYLPTSSDLELAYSVDAVLNVGGYLYGGVAALLLLGYAAARHPHQRGRRQALIVVAGLVPWTAYLAWSLGYGLIHGPAEPLPAWEAVVEPVTILIEALAFFTAIIGFHLFELGLVIRKGLIYGVTTGVLIALLYLAVVLSGELATVLLGVEPNLWHLGMALVVLGVVFQPLAGRVTQTVDATFFPEKVRLRRLQRTLIPSLARITDIEHASTHLVRRIQRSLKVETAALLVSDEAREFYRVRALVGDFPAGAKAAEAVLTREELSELWPAGQRRALLRWGASAADGAEPEAGPEAGGERRPPSGLERMLHLLAAEYVLPIQLGRDLVAVLVLGPFSTGASIDRGDLAELEILAQQASAMLENARLFHLATHDPLTSLPRRRVLEERLALELSRSARRFEPIAVAMMDIDDFKRVNDGFGHLAGDKVLRAVADALLLASRKTDVIARYGGEEFILLAPGSDEEGARVVGEKMRAAAAGCEVLLEGGKLVKVTLSIGIAVVRPRDVHHDGNEFIRRADHALYQAKLAGKNRVEIFQPA